WRPRGACGRTVRALQPLVASQLHVPSLGNVMNVFRLTIWILGGILLGNVGALTLTGSQSDADYDHGFIAYSRTAAADPVARLQQKIDSGEVTLPFDSRWGYLPAILEALKIPPSSQSLVFSKTSFQFTRIFPETPRA